MDTYYVYDETDIKPYIEAEISRRPYSYREQYAEAKRKSFMWGIGVGVVVFIAISWFVVSLTWDANVDKQDRIAEVYILVGGLSVFFGTVPSVLFGALAASTYKSKVGMFSEVRAKAEKKMVADAEAEAERS
jgi:hypothetical protein